MKSVFTIVTNSHVNQGLAALHSLRKNVSDLDYQYIIFTFDDQPYHLDKIDNIYIIPINRLNLPEYNLLLDRSLNRTLTHNELRQNVKNADTARWALKPFLIEHLLSISTECLYVDSDLYFINNIDSLISSIDNIGLSPHFRPYGTTEIFEWMSNRNVIGDTNVFTDGYFNGGFIITKNTDTTLQAINWWKNCCLNRCEINKEIGFYVDQRYLDFMYMHFKNISKIEDLGCNMAEWNIYTYKITNVDLEKNQFLINNTFTPKFFHFSGSHFKFNPIMLFFHHQFDQLIQNYRNMTRQ